MARRSRSGLRGALAGLAVTLAALAGDAGAGAPVAAAERPAPIDVDPARGLVAVDVREMPLAEVLRRIGEQAGLRVIIQGDVSARITAAFTAVPLDEGIKRLARGHSFVLNYTPARDGAPGSVLAEVRLFGAAPAGRGAAPVVSTPPRVAASERAAQGLSAPEPSARLAALRGPVRRGDEAMAATLAQVLAGDPDASVRAEAARLLAQVRGPQAVAALGQALADPDQAVRRQAVQAYATVQPPELAAEALGAVLAQDPSPLVRRQAARSLGRLRTEEAGRALAAASADASPLVQREAASALASWEKRRAAPR